ncbi:aldo/keto reductase [Aureibacter tunicatorum]|uniref:Aryl-alcohol dehydrogenase-like predicted oxidoreductase n=1 Tax=Aureibacter tunicatorum TaxID=866807 RepID=A0AAE3XTT9_9BACT|nr:aldo/keto reductase [Aureibacter tunicatorum]MDR6241564.1 aryl-alcohol dehydrogenase-like predicted oxidoreductase [Aureibacter tunicatorum]BDD07212.1 aldo/keto reductase [Aureibacter tunicatorum]
MEYCNLGKTNLNVSKICLGTMTFGEQNTLEDGFEQMDYAQEQGINFFDTAELYAVPPKPETQGKTEEIIGEYFSQRNCRDKIILATKVTGPTVDWIRDGKPYDKKAILSAVEGSLKRLKTDYIDLYQLHWPTRHVYQFTNFFKEQVNFDTNQVSDHILEVIQTMEELIAQGKIRHYGLSNETAWGTMKYLQIAEKNNLKSPVSIQNEYSLLCRKFEPDLSEVCAAESVDLLAWSPLATGLLSGKYKNGKYPKGSRLDISQGARWRQTDNCESAIIAYEKVAEKHNLNFAQMSIAFTLQRPFKTVSIIGATTMDQLKSNIDAINLKLSDDVMNDLSEVRKKYPIVF